MVNLPEHQRVRGGEVGGGGGSHGLSLLSPDLPQDIVHITVVVVQIFPRVEGWIKAQWSPTWGVGLFG